MGDRSDAVGERYVALGDSYTIGEGVGPAASWPALLTTHLREHGIAIDLVANPSVTGWTAQQLIDHELPVFEASRPTFATLLIGVNDWVQEVETEVFAARLALIVDRVLATLGNPGRLVMVTIPDFSVTPAGARYARGRDIAAGIAGFNDIVRQQAARAGVALVDIFPLSQELSGAEYVAADELHPSALAYARWEELILPAALAALAR
jgi:lysophospholipase L1-like esterase